MDIEGFDFEKHGDGVELYHKLCATLESRGRFGAAAPEIGVPYRVFVAGDPKNVPESCIAFFNPFVVNESEEELVAEEADDNGSVVKVSRPSYIRVRFTSQYGETDTMVFEGLTARTVHRMMDKIDSVRVTNRTSRLRRDIAQRKLKKQLKKRRHDHVE